MTTVLGIVGFALLFALFGTLINPRRGGCHGASCDTCDESCDLDLTDDGTIRT